MQELVIRNELQSDYRKVEELTREAFWNLYVPGCNEHYVVHILREHKDFISELDLVVELDGEIVGNVMYTKSYLVDQSGSKKEVLTFGPISVLPKYQRKGIGKKLLETSFIKARELGFDSIVIFGNPGNYVSRGFKSCKKFNVALENGIYPTAMLVKELEENAFDGRQWIYYESDAYNIDEKEAEMFDRTFEKKEKKYQESQEEFFIYSHSSII